MIVKLILEPKDFRDELKRLIHSYSGYYWASAWADGNTFDLFMELKKNRAKIKKIVIGTSFHRTDPSFIEEFMNDPGVRFYDDHKEGALFHPKMYLFTKDKEWELLVGSANFTYAAFNSNKEVALLLNNSDNSSGTIRKRVDVAINDFWNSGSRFDANELELYRKAHEDTIRNRDDLTIKYFEKVNRSTAWADYIRIIKRGYLVAERLSLLNKVRINFAKYKSFNKMDEDTRSRIAGYVGLRSDGLDWRTFGSMRGKGIFMTKVKNNDQNISDALDQIPLTGNVTKEEYDAFVSLFKKSFNTQLMVVPASRLLTMKRPDFFLCLTSKNRKRFFECYKNGHKRGDYDWYWKEVILKVHKSKWWKANMPSNALEQDIWDKRVAMLDAIYYYAELE